MLYDGNAALKEEDIKEKFDRDAKVTVVLGEIKRSDLLGVELCIISPGIPLDTSFCGVVDDARFLFWERLSWPTSAAWGSWPPSREPMERLPPQPSQGRY